MHRAAAIWPPLEAAPRAAVAATAAAVSSSVPQSQPAATAAAARQQQQQQQQPTALGPAAGTRKRAQPLMFKMPQDQTANHEQMQKLSSKKGPNSKKMRKMMQREEFDPSSLIQPRISRVGTGPVIPPYQFSNGRIARRNFQHKIDAADEQNGAASLCDICREPVENYFTHIGRKDHALLDQHFEQIVEYRDRSWNAADMFSRCDETFGSLTNLLSSCQRVFAEEERQRRLEITAMSAFLLDRQIIAGGSNQVGSSTKGSIFGFFLYAHLCIHTIVPSAMMRMQPAANIESCSSVEDFVSSTFNHETFYDMLSMGSLMSSSSAVGPPSPSSPPPPAPSSPSGFSSENFPPVAQTIMQKSAVVRGILSQLKSATLEDQEVPFASTVQINFEDDEEFVCSLQHSGGVLSGDAAASAGAASEDLEDDDDEDDDDSFKYLSEAAREKIQRIASLSNSASTGNSNNTSSKQRKIGSRRLQPIVSNDNEDLSSFGSSSSFHHHQHQNHQHAAESKEPKIRAGAAETLMGILGQAMVADLIHCRVSEYVVRAEPTWRGIGELEQLHPRLPAASGGSGDSSSSSSSSSSTMREAVEMSSNKIRVQLSSRPELVSRPWLPEAITGSGDGKEAEQLGEAL